MSSMKLSMSRLLQVSTSYLTKRSISAGFQQVEFLEQYPGYRHTHVDRFSTVCHITATSSTEVKEKSFRSMDGGQAKSSDGGSLSKRAQKRLARCQKHKEQLKQRKASQKKMTQKDDAGYSVEDFHQSAYYFENGLRKVYPYTFTFATYAKGRWVGRTIKAVLEKEFGFDEPEDLLKSFNAGKIHVNNQQVGPDYTVRDCDLISHRIHRHENPVTCAPIEIIKDTEDLVVINKPSSIPCHPCGRYRFNSIVFILGKEMGYTNLRNIYRLDRLTSGVLMLAKTTETTKTLEDQVANRQVQKEYVCRVAGKFPKGPVLVDQPLRALSNKLRLQIVCPTGKASQTEFELVSYNGTSSVVKCRPFTGRTHQIRVHLQYLGHPIINDVFYNNTAWGHGNGKGGNYEVAFEDVCAKILKDHHANLWDGGENPLYFTKVREMEERKPASEMPQDELTTSVLVSDKSMSCVSPETTCRDSESYRLQNAPSDNENVQAGCHEENSDAEPPSKKLKEDQNDDAVELLYSPLRKHISSEPSKIHLCESLSTGEEILQCEMNVTDISNSTEHRAAITDGSDLNKDPAAVGANGKNDLCEGQRLPHLCLDGRPGFEMSRWSVDTSCDLCKKLPIDPRERDMVMFLHALKYKGPGWEYETHLPDWAKADWSLEEGYVDVQSVSCR